jgi:hypothetical protein
MHEGAGPPPKSDILLYRSLTGSIRVEVTYEDESFWLSQKQLADVFEVDVRTVNEHLKNIFGSGELEENSVIRKFRITAADGKSYLTSFYHLDAIIAVVYLVKETKGTKDSLKLRSSERDKVDCGKKHFDAFGVPFAVVVSADEV